MCTASVRIFRHTAAIAVEITREFSAGRVCCTLRARTSEIASGLALFVTNESWYYTVCRYQCGDSKQGGNVAVNIGHFILF
jgi:hypothetical protein